MKRYIYEDIYELEEGKVGKSLLLALSLTISSLGNTSCTMLYDTIDYIENVEDSQTRDLLNKYFTKKEREFILHHLTDVESRSSLGTTHIKYNPLNKNDFVCNIELYNDEISNLSLNTDLPFEVMRGLTIIHELCHVLHNYDNHGNKWLSSFESKMIDYCWDSIEDGTLDDYYGEYNVFEKPQDLIDYIVLIKTMRYKF